MAKQNIPSKNMFFSYTAVYWEVQKHPPISKATCAPTSRREQRDHKQNLSLKACPCAPYEGFLFLCVASLQVFG